MIIFDNNLKFKGEFPKVAEILNVECYQVSKGNHDVVMIKRFNQFLNASLTIFNSNRGTNWVFVEGALMTVYAWNSATAITTNLSCSLISLGRAFHFPIGFTNQKHVSFDVSLNTVENYSHNMFKCWKNQGTSTKSLSPNINSPIKKIKNALKSC